MPTWRNRINRCLNDGGMHIVFQPIATLRPFEVIGYEALARFPEPNLEIDPDISRVMDDTYVGFGPAIWFAEARLNDQDIDLELAAIQLALDRLDEVPDDRYLSLNAGSRTILTPALHEMLDRYPLDRIVLELTEHDIVENYTKLRDALKYLRTGGASVLVHKELLDSHPAAMRFGVDDVGSGFASMRHLLALNPDIIKLDLELVRDIDTDAARRALVAGLIHFAVRTKTKVVAEGIETQAEFRTLEILEVDAGQGYFIGKPMKEIGHEVLPKLK